LIDEPPVKFLGANSVEATGVSWTPVNLNDIPEDSTSLVHAVQRITRRLFRNLSSQPPRDLTIHPQPNPTAVNRAGLGEFHGVFRFHGFSNLRQHFLTNSLNGAPMTVDDEP
jgi:hypothetical protein